MEEEIKQCKHKWLPNGIIKRGVWRTGYLLDEEVFASCICEKCGEIKIQAEKLNKLNQ